MPDTVKESRVDNAYERLKQEILANRMPAGFQATEPEIALMLGMSRTPVREALIRLEADGLVQIIPRRGVRVLPIRLEDMREIYQILTALEPEAAASIAASKPSRETLEPLYVATEDMARAIKDGDREAWARADDRFHRDLIGLNANKRLNAMVMTLFDQAHRARMFTLPLRDMPVRSTQDHREILDEMLAGNSETVRKIFHSHRQRAAEELLTILDKFRQTQF